MPDLNPGSEFAGYVIEDVAGRGGMGVVYRARQRRPDRLVALKVIAPDLANDPDFRSRFERESDTAAAIEHPNVIPVYEVNDVDGLLFITMRFVEGTDLRAMIAERGRLEPALAADLIGQIGAALDAAHERGLVHRDVKPANVLMAGRPGSYHAYLTDFGLTKNAQAESGMTKTGMFVGTLDYIAPEQLMGGALDARADVYALGCVLYQALTGQVPYPAESGMAKMYAHGNNPPPVPSQTAPDLPPQFDEVVARAMAKDPNDRYLSAGDLGRAARAAAQAQSLSRSERSVATGDAAPSDATAVGGVAPTAAAPAPTMAAPGATAAGATAPGVAPTTAGQGPPPATTAGAAPGGGGRGGGGRNRLLAIGGGIFALALVAILAVVLLAGGGGDDTKRLSKADYESQVSDVIRPIGITANSVSVPAQLPNIESERLKIADSLGKLKAAFSGAADKLDGIEPPSDVEAIHTELSNSLSTVVKDIDAAQAASDTGDSKGYEAALTSFEQHFEALDAIEKKYAAAGYQRLGSGSGDGPKLNAEQQDVADTVASAQRAFRDKDVNLYCLSRSPAYMGRVYGGSYGFASCKKAGAAGLKAEIPELLRGGDLTVKTITIVKGGKADVATVKLTGDGGAQVTAIVKQTRDDPVWRVDSFSAG